MNIPFPSAQLDEELEKARTKLVIINSQADEATKEIEAWLKANGRWDSFECGVVNVHAWRLRTHSAALAELVAGLGTPLPGRLLLLSGGTHILGPFDGDAVVETESAYDLEKIYSLGARDIRDAIEFDTELKDMFGFAWVDEEVRNPLANALHLLLDMLEESVANVPGMVVSVLKVLLKGHPRGFGRYYSGRDPWPRPSAEIQAEIDARMPDALYWLRYELKEALEQEAALANPEKGDEDER